MSTPDPIELAARVLRHRDRSRAEIADRLEQAGVGGSELEAALETLEGIGYVDDGRYAQARAAALAARGRGDAAIRSELAASGVDGEAMEEALAALEPEVDRARAIVLGRGASATTARYLDRNGFSPDAIGTALEGVAGGEGTGV